MSSGELEHDVLTSQHIASMKAAINQPDKFIKKLESLATQDIAFYTSSLAELNKTKKNLNTRVEKLEDGIGKTLRTDGSIASILKDVKAYAAKAEADSKRQHEMKYFFGQTEVRAVSALEGKIKEELPATAKGSASQALNDALGKSAVKDAAKVGTGVKHASAGNKNKKDSSCTIFFTREEKDEGMTTVLKIVAVGSHTGPSSYMIHWSSVSKLKAGSDFSL